ncbi:MAG TPA: hypothetical protein VI197_11305, partial [Polyangiaceae bacterium]
AARGWTARGAAALAVPLGRAPKALGMPIIVWRLADVVGAAGGAAVGVPLAIGAGIDSATMGRLDCTMALPRWVPSIKIGSLQRLHLMRTFRPWTFASGTEYLDEQLRHWTFMATVAKLRRFRSGLSALV